MRLLFALVLMAWAAGAPGASSPALSPLPGEPASPLVLKDIQGASHDLARYRGQVVLVNFWATWCEPCRLEMPSMQRLRDRLGKRFVVLAVNVDEPDARVRNFIAQTKLDLTVLMDPGKTVSRAWGVRVLPTSFLIGPDGRARYRLIGDIDWDNETVMGTVTQLLKGG